MDAEMAFQRRIEAIVIVAVLEARDEIDTAQHRRTPVRADTEDGFRQRRDGTTVPPERLGKSQRPRT